MPKKISYEYVKEYIEEKEYKLLSKEYLNSQDKLHIECPFGHKYYVRWNRFQYGRRCPYCRNIKRSIDRTLDFDFVKEYIENEGYTLVSTNYKNAHSKMDTICPEGHDYQITWNNFKSGYRCKKCSYKIRGENKKLTYEFVKEKFEEENYKLLSDEYISANSKMDTLCPVGHLWKTSYGNFKDGCRCYICNLGSVISKPEKEIIEYVKSLDLNTKILENDRKTILNPLTNYKLELDIFIPKLKKAIEFNGVYWHSFKKTKIKDKIKKEQCEILGINLLVIEEQDYIDDKNKCLNKVKDFLIC